jgi:hypothetical protein
VRGLPPPPAEVAHLEQTFDVNGLQTSIGFWLFNGSIPALAAPSAAVMLSDWFLTCLPSLLELQHIETIPTTCRLSTVGFRYVEAAPPAHGAWTGGQASSVALGLHWLTGQARPRSGPITFVPGVPDAFVTDNWRVNELAYGNMVASGRDLFSALNAIHAPDGSPTVVGTVQRSHAGAPLGSALFSPYVAVVPTAKLVTIRRRIPARGALRPS